MTTRKRRIGDPIKPGRTVRPESIFDEQSAYSKDWEVNEKVELERKLKIADEAGIGGWVLGLLSDVEAYRKVSRSRGERNNKLAAQVYELERKLQVAENEIDALNEAARGVPKVIKGHGGSSMRIYDTGTIYGPSQTLADVHDRLLREQKEAKPAIRVGDVVRDPQGRIGEVRDVVGKGVRVVDAESACKRRYYSADYSLQCKVLGHVGEGGEYPGRGEWQTHTVEEDGTVIYEAACYLRLTPAMTTADAGEQAEVIQGLHGGFDCYRVSADAAERNVGTRAEAIAWLKAQKKGDGDV